MSAAPARRLEFVLLGGQSLLIQCAELILERGHSVRRVVSADRRIVQWTQERGIDCVPRHESLLNGKDPCQCDYLLSITNLTLLPEQLLRWPRVAAINFHDGPLPRYAGLNAPVWALLNGEAEYGITWHEMASGADRGRILLSRTFPVAEGESAFSLNARCYEAGLESFAELLSQMESGRLAPVEQDFSQRSYFGLSDRPSGLGVLDWSRPAAELERLVRALDFGRYPNPVSLPKVDLGDTLLLLREATLTTARRGGKPGTVTFTPDGKVAVACGAGELVIDRLTRLDGAAVEPQAEFMRAGRGPGSALPAATPVAGMEAFTRAMAANEAWWLGQLAGLELSEAPFAQRPGAVQTATVSVDVEDCARDPAGATALFLLLLARLSNQLEAGVAYAPASLATLAPQLRRFAGSRAVLSARIHPHEPYYMWSQRVSELLDLAEERCGWLSDLPARHPEWNAQLRAVGSAPVGIIRCANLDEGERLSQSGDIRHALCLVMDDRGACRLVGDGSSVDAQSLQRFAACARALAAAVSAGDVPCGTASILSLEDARRLAQWTGRADAAIPPLPLIHQQFEQRAATLPEERACVFAGESITYAELNRAANRIAHHLGQRGVAPGSLVGLRIERSIEMVAAMLGVLKAGAAYVPLDPGYPEERLQLMAGDAGLQCVLTFDDAHKAMHSGESGADPGLAGTPDDLAYVIYTSGSTGRPKGVMVAHREVTNFFAGMDERLGGQPGKWLAVTSISFDISVLELLWTLARGFTVVLHGDAGRATGDRSRSSGREPMQFGLFYWNVAAADPEQGTEKYRLLLESAKFADTHGFNAVWTPERHFESFGGLFPNPSVTSAALATITRNVALRAGSCVVPLHSPIRIAEEWAVVDNLSNGRVGISVASGWAAPDFAIRPESFADSKRVMFESTELLRRLWRGETVGFPGPKGEVQVRTLPRPIQKELPIWVTTAGNVDTYVQAGRIGANVLTHLLGQSVEDVAKKVAAYRAAWTEAGHAGRGIVTLMLHTFVGADAAVIEDTVRQPMKSYLASAVALVKAAAWQFPAFASVSAEQGRTLDEFFASASPSEMDELLEFAFQRYFHDSGLFGTPEHCLETVRRVHGAGVDEIACLIDFGVATDTVLAHLPYLDQLRLLAQEGSPAPMDMTLAGLLQREQVTHMQCTPTMATMLIADAEARSGLAGLKHLLVGGEALPPDLARSLLRDVGGQISNMYGPTETTVWSTAGTVDESAMTPSNGVSIGTPLLNQTVEVLDSQLQPLPPGVTGEIVIGGAGVTRGYLNRPELTAERFAGDPPRYRTGDRGRFLPDGRLECLGRADLQVKLRGYRLEPGEIEAVLREQPGIAEAAVIVREFAPGDRRLVGFVRTADATPAPESALKASLALRLPDFMVPAAIHSLRDLPRTPNGKLDRKALEQMPAMRSAPVPRAAEAGAAISDVSQDDARLLVLDIWKRVLGAAEIGLRDNFFDIGGHSLLVIQVLRELRDRISRPVQLTDLFRHTTVESLARFLAEDQAGNGSAARGRSRAEARRTAMNRRM